MNKPLFVDKYSDNDKGRFKYENLFTKKMVTKNIQKIKRQIIPLLKKNGVIKAGIFGSYARGEEKKNSDVDILIKQKGKKSLLDLVGLEMELKARLKKKVDLLDYDGLSPYLKDCILKEEVRIL